MASHSFFFFQIKVPCPGSRGVWLSSPTYLFSKRAFTIILLTTLNKKTYARRPTVLFCGVDLQSYTDTYWPGMHATAFWFLQIWFARGLSSRSSVFLWIQNFWQNSKEKSLHQQSCYPVNKAISCFLLWYIFADLPHMRPKHILRVLQQHTHTHTHNWFCTEIQV